MVVMTVTNRANAFLIHMNRSQGSSKMRAMPVDPWRYDAPPARVCIVSLRGINKHAVWCSNYEFEDVITDIDNVDIYTLEPNTTYDTHQ